MKPPSSRRGPVGGWGGGGSGPRGRAGWTATCTMPQVGCCGKPGVVERDGASVCVATRRVARLVAPLAHRPPARTVSSASTRPRRHLDGHRGRSAARTAFAAPGSGRPPGLLEHRQDADPVDVAALQPHPSLRRLPRPRLPVRVPVLELDEPDLFWRPGCRQAPPTPAWGCPPTLSKIAGTVLTARMRNGMQRQDSVVLMFLYQV